MRLDLKLHLTYSGWIDSDEFRNGYIVSIKKLYEIIKSDSQFRDEFFGIGWDEPESIRLEIIPPSEESFDIGDL